MVRTDRRQKEYSTLTKEYEQNSRDGSLKNNGKNQRSGTMGGIWREWIGKRSGKE